jgi:hypothetical protein
VSTTVSVPAFPNVPIAPGVPPVLRSVGNTEVSVVSALVSVDSLLDLVFPRALQWGIFDQNGNPIVVGDAVVSVDFRGEFDVPDYPVEQGGFASYNKVAHPKDIRVTVAADGTTISPAQMLQAVDASVASTALFSVGTPDAIYASMSLTHYDYRRTSQNGAQMITVDVWATEIRMTATITSGSNAQTPSGMSPVSNGTVQPQPPTASQSSSLGARIDSATGGSLFSGLGLA